VSVFFEDLSLAMSSMQQVDFALCHADAHRSAFRTVRKTIFSLTLWKPRRQRAHSQRRWLVDPGRPTHGKAVGLVTGCVNARSICRVLSLSDRRYSLNPLSQTRID